MAAVCKTVGSAYVGSNPTPATTSENAPLAAETRAADEAAFAASPSAGQRAPDFTLPRLGDGAPVSLAGLWRSKPLVMEFGSFT